MSSVVRNAAIIFLSKPTSYPIPGEHLEYRDDATIDLENVPLNGGVLAKAICFGVDPWYRLRMNDPEDYVPGQPIKGHGVLRVLRSENPDLKVGDYISDEGDFPFQEYVVLPKDAPNVSVLKDEGIPWPIYLGALGLAGQTAWVSFKAFANPKPGETIYVSTGAGAVGSLVCQLAKASGLRVISSTGSDDKVQYLKDVIGVDVAFNYKKQDLDEVLKEHGPLDLCFENVGGKTLETVLWNMKTFGRIIICGSISDYNTAQPYGVTNLRLFHERSLSMYGFRVFPLMRRVGDFGFYDAVPKLYKEGKWNMNHQIMKGLEHVPQLLLEIQKGTNAGKPVVVLSDE